MAEIVCVLIITLSVLITQTQALSVVNNVTVPSDFLTKIFFDHIKNNPNLLDIKVKNNGTYDSEKCILGLQEIVDRFPSYDVLPFVDAWGKIPSGILYGHLQDLGNFDQCMRTSAILSEATGLVHGQYCFANIPLIPEQVLDMPLLGLHTRARNRGLEDLIRISIAVCVPDTCEPSLLKVIFQEAADQFLNGAFTGISVNRCKTAKAPEFKAINIIGILIFSVFGALVVMSTAYDGYTEYFEKPQVPILLAFSVYTNGRKLFKISNSKSPNSIECILGIRIFSMAWVVLCHNYSLTPMLPMINIIDLIEWLNKASSMHIVMATVSVDTFLFISGLLVAWLGFRELDKRNGKLNVVSMYIHRYIRLTPPVIVMILFFLSINKYMGTGPYRTIFETFHDNCKTNWWSTLLYIQNYVNPEEICVPQTWYLAVDTQLYILSPLILIPLWKWGRRFVPILFILSFLSIGCVIATYLREGYTNFMGILENNQSRLTYSPTHTRYSVWLIGVGFGYFMYKNKDKSIYIPKGVQILAWTACFATILAIIYGPYFTIDSDRATTVLEAAVYESCKRIGWAVVLSWIVFACHFGFGGVINSFLSHPFWQPFGRLTYAMYLVHMAVQTINYGTTRTDIYFSNYTEILFFWSTFGISLMAAIVMTLVFESPVLVIEKAILGSEKKNKTLHDVDNDVGIIKTEYIETSQKFA